jgi:hypothetical protein
LGQYGIDYAPGTIRIVVEFKLKIVIFRVIAILPVRIYYDTVYVELVGIANEPGKDGGLFVQGGRELLSAVQLDRSSDYVFFLFGEGGKDIMVFENLQAQHAMVGAPEIDVCAVALELLEPSDIVKKSYHISYQCVRLGNVNLAGEP